VTTLARLRGSSFRARFVLDDGDIAYLRQHGESAITEHARKFLSDRIAAAHPYKDGRQTPWKGHPVFVAQHATATCCRGCVAKWHGISAGRLLTETELKRLTELVMAWLTAQLISADTIRRRRAR
jgi:hypothetical protein